MVRDSAGPDGATAPTVFGFLNQEEMNFTPVEARGRFLVAGRCLHAA
jgi:hypothetical protein